MALQPLMLFLASGLFPICTLTAKANNNISSQEKCKNRRIKRTKATIVVTDLELIISHFYLFPAKILTAKNLAFSTEDINHF